MKKSKKRKVETLDTLIIIVAILLTIAGFAYYLKRKKTGALVEDSYKDQISAFAPTENVNIDFKEVNNSYFATHPHAFATVDSLNIRESPGTGNVVKQVNKGDYIGEHTGKSTDIGMPTSPGRWAKLITPEGKTVWVFSGMIESKVSKSLSGFEKIKVIA